MADGEGQGPDQGPEPPDGGPTDEARPSGRPPWERPATPPPGFAGPRPPLPPGQGPATVPSVAPPLPPTPDRASTKAIARSSNRAVVFWVVAALALIGAGVAFKALTGRESKVSTAKASRFDDAATTTAPVKDPAFHQFVRDYCSVTDKSLASKATAYRPGGLAYTTVFYPQAIGAPGQRTGWFMLNVSPTVGTPEEVSSFSGTPSSRLQLATCVTAPVEQATGVNCTYQGDPTLGEEGAQVVQLVETTYDVTVYEVASGKPVATGKVSTDAKTCPKDALVEMGDTVSAPMTHQILTEWFREHAKGGQFS